MCIHHSNFIPYLSSFGGGVIFAVGVIHLLNEGVPKIEEWCGGHCKVAYPYILFVGAYLLMLLFFRVLSKSQTHKHGSGEKLLEGSGVELVKEAGGLLTFLSLSVHGLVLGLAIGLDTDMTAVINTAIGVLAHKWADTLALSLVLLRSHNKYVSISYMLPLQALVCPLGIILGLLVSDNLSELCLGLALCVTAGFLTYFFTSDVVPELFKEGKKWSEFALVCVGATLFTVALSLGEYYSGG